MDRWDGGGCGERAGDTAEGQHAAAPGHWEKKSASSLFVAELGMEPPVSLGQGSTPSYAPSLSFGSDCGGVYESVAKWHRTVRRRAGGSACKKCKL